VARQGQGERRVGVDARLSACQEELDELKHGVSGKAAAFRATVPATIERYFVLCNRAVGNAVKVLGGEPSAGPTLRDVVLAAVFLVQWRRFKSSDPFDFSVVREFAALHPPLIGSLA